MSILKNIGLSLSSAALVAVLAGFAPTSAIAQERGAERLANQQRLIVVSEQTDAKTTTCCAKCKDTSVSVAQPPGKGGKQEVATIQRHECPACSTKVVTEGHGKQAQNKVVHTCAMSKNDRSSCCATTSR